jgi:hypothetical protein
MINPTPDDIGRGVVYTNEPFNDTKERGFITSYNDAFVFVRYDGSTHSKATRRDCLDWEHPRATVHAS